MARRKMAKRAVKRDISPRSYSRMEKDFLSTPLMLSGQLSKEIKALKQKESKLKQNLSKSKAKSKTSEIRLKSMQKQRDTSAQRKLFAAAKKTHGELLKNQTVSTRELNTTSTALETANNQYAKLMALKRHLSQFQKDWSLQAKIKKTTPKSIKAKPKTRRKNTERVTLISAKDRVQDQFEKQPRTEQFENTFEAIEETQKVAS